MSFLDTEPAPIQRLDAFGPWSRFRVAEPRQREATLREICRGDVPLTLGGAGGATVSALLWALDDQQGNLRFSLALQQPGLNDVLAAPEAWAAGYLQQAKVQFELRGLRLDVSGQHPLLHAEVPRLMLHLPRRRSVRVRRAEALSPQVCFRHPQATGTVLRLRVLDISSSGCALWQPIDGPLLATGTEVSTAEVELDADALFHTGLRVQQVAMSGGARLGMRLGCTWQGLDQEAAQTLQRWIARGRRRRDLVSLSFD